MAARASGEEAPLALRPAHPFEEALGRSLALEMESTEDAADELAQQESSPADRVVPGEKIDVPERPREGRHEDRGAEPAESRVPREPTGDERRTDQPAPKAKRAEPSGPAPEPTRPPPEASAPPPEPPAQETPRREPPPAPAPESPRGPERPRSPRPAARRRAPRRRARPRAPTRTRTPTPDLATLLHRHVIPALVDRGVVERGEGAIRPPVQGPASPPPGKFTIEAGNVAGLPPAPPEPARDELPSRRPPPDVHVHIDRVVVTRGPSPPPPLPAPPEPAAAPVSTVDHDAYLARRSEGR
jgi:hypothetical protein